MGDLSAQEPAIKTPLFDFHQAQGGKVVAFAGFQLPIQYKTGIKGEHLHTRAAAGLFDVSHMGQFLVTGADRVAALETLMPADIASLEPGQQRYSFLTNEAGGILDDLMVTNAGETLRVVVNAACKDADLKVMQAGLTGDAAVEVLPDLALVALQGPKAAAVLSRFDPAAAAMAFMTGRELNLDGVAAWVSRSGYTGEDGYEISVPADAAGDLAELLTGDERVAPIGLGARDTLRLEAGLCLYGNDIDETTTPVEAGLRWTISKRRREEGGFAGADVILGQIADGPSRRLVGLRPDGAAPAREGTEVASKSGDIIGHVTSGGFGPTVDGPIAMGYVAAEHAAVDTEIDLMVRGKPRPGRIVKMPFAQHRYFKD